MKKIAFLVPYFGNMNNYFNLWLKSCEYNSSIDWLIFTDDHSEYDYPNNVKVYYKSFSEFKKMIQKKYNFKIVLNNAYKICDYRVAFGEIFEDYLNEYEYWGYCDLDLVFGDIRKFLTDQILEQYQKILKLGHLTLYKNTKENNSRYKERINGREIYKEIFQCDLNCFFDEIAINKIYEMNNIDIYDKTEFANLIIRSFGFVSYQVTDYNSCNGIANIFRWNKGKLTREYYCGDTLKKEEFMYIHFLKRPMINTIKSSKKVENYIIIPNKFIEEKNYIDKKWINRKAKNRFYYEYYIKRLSFSFIYKKIKFHKLNIKENIHSRFIEINFK